jgi:hypothetical protein
MSRRSIVILASVLVLLVGAGSGLWFALPRIAETIITSRLEAEGLAPVSVSVSRVDLAGARLDHLTVGQGALRVDGAEITWRPRALAPDTLTIESLHINGRWSEDNGLSLGPLDALLQGTETPDPPSESFSLPVPKLSVQDARIQITLPEGVLNVTAQGTIHRAAPGPAVNLSATLSAPGLTGRMAFQGAAAGTGATPVTGDGYLELTATDFAAPGLANSVSGTLAADIGIGADTIRIAARAPVALTLSSLSPSLSEGLESVAPTAASAPVILSLTGREGRAPHLTVSGLDDLSTLSLASDGLGLTIETGSARANLLAAGSLRLEDGLPTAALHDLSGQAEGLVLADTPLAVTFDNANATLSMTGIAAEGDITLDAGAIDIAGAAIQSARLETRLRLTAEPDGSGALYTDGGEIRLEGFAPAPDLTAPSPLILTLADTESPLARLHRLEDGGLGIALRTSFAATDLRLRRGNGPQARLFRAAFDQLSVDADARLPQGSAPALVAAGIIATGGTLSVDDIVVSNAKLDAGLDAAGPRVSLTGDMMQLPGEAPELAARSPLRPYRLSLEAAPPATEDTSGRFSLALDLRDAAQTRLASATGWADISAGTGRLKLTVPRQVFDPNSLRPEHLHGALGTFASGVTGSIAAEGTLSWTAAGVTPQIDLMLRDLSLTQGFVTLRRINGVIRVDGLAPLHTPLGQSVSIAAVEAGLPLSNVSADFQISDDHLHIDSATATLADGTLMADPTSIPLDLASGAMTLRVRDMRLAPLVDMLDIQGLNAAGALAGDIPLRFAGGDVVINNATLSNQQPDRVTYAPEQPPDALSGGGQSVDLVMEALQDFRYNALRVTVDGRASGELTVTLHIAGYNPDFYDGYPVEFNLSVSGALAQAVQAGMQGYQVPDRIRDRMLDFQSTQ